MTHIENTDILIIGSGPAGISTALHLVQQDPAWAQQMVVVDKAVHPREKLCGGGVTQTGLAILDALGLEFEPANVPIRELRFQFEEMIYAVQEDPVFRVVRRAEFDHWLVRVAEQRGVTVRQGEAVTALTPHTDFVEVVTEKTTFHAQVVVVADGSCSFVRRALKWCPGTGNHRMARLLEVLTPETANHPLFQQGIAVFDFSPQCDGVQGYVWDFPSMVRHALMMNRGVFDSRIRPEQAHAPLKRVLRAALIQRQRQLADVSLKGHPIHWFSVQDEFAKPRLVLAGDAAGVDPFVGEGISFALGYGRVAAQTIIDAFAREDFSFANYKAHVLNDPLLSQLVSRAKLARLLYRIQSRRVLKVLWWVFPLLARLVRWYKPNLMPFNAATIVRVRESN